MENVLQCFYVISTIKLSMRSNHWIQTWTRAFTNVSSCESNDNEKE